MSEAPDIEMSETLDKEPNARGFSLNDLAVMFDDLAEIVNIS